MKIYTRDMHKYILESSAVIRSVIENRKEITNEFVCTLMSNDIKTIYIVESGTFCYSAQSARSFMERMLAKKIHISFPIPFVNGEHFFSKDVLVIGISATGVSASTIKVLDHTRQYGQHTIALTNDMQSEVIRHCDALTLLDFDLEDVSPKRKSYITEIATLLLCAMEYALAAKLLTQELYEQMVNAMLWESHSSALLLPYDN